jgi:hypothetical protein
VGGLVGAVNGVFTNERAGDQLATRIPIHGTLDDPEVAGLRAIASAAHNVFVRALFNGLDNDITWTDAPGHQSRR